MIRIQQIKVSFSAEQNSLLIQKAASLLNVPREEIAELSIVRRSVDARKKPDIFYVYTVDLALKSMNEEKILSWAKKKKELKELVSKAEVTAYHFPKVALENDFCPPVIVGTGPAGLFCGYFLALHGFRPVLLERGRCVEQRKEDVERFWEKGVLDPSSNVQFGEGGAGTFSDGKLNTLVKDRAGRNRAVLETFVRFGAKESILYDAKPHIGTDVLFHIVRAMREEILRLGGTVRFESCVTDLLITDGKICGVQINHSEKLPCKSLVLAIGHSARDTFEMLDRRGIPMEAKAFAVGFRVQHRQSLINKSQYGMETKNDLGAAVYKLAAKTAVKRGVYSFCMCPGGYVVNASSEEGMTAVNGMSYSGRDGENANSAIIVSVSPSDYPGEDALSGIRFQRELERRAFACAEGKIPLQRYGDFKQKITGEGSAEQHSKKPKKENATEKNLLRPMCKGEYAWADLSGILPKDCNLAFVEGMSVFGRQIPCFDQDEAILAGVESRTSSAVRINRDENLQSAIGGLYPCGEGAGYAGGITSAAMDGLRVAEQIAISMGKERGICCILS